MTQHEQYPDPARSPLDYDPPWASSNHVEEDNYDWLNGTQAPSTPKEMPKIIEAGLALVFFVTLVGFAILIGAGIWKLVSLIL